MKGIINVGVTINEIENRKIQKIKEAKGLPLKRWSKMTSL